MRTLKSDFYANWYFGAEAGGGGQPAFSMHTAIRCMDFDIFAVVEFEP